jgi:hypothetical protein
MRFACSNERGLVLDVVQRVGHQNAVKICEWPRLPHEISEVRGDLHPFVCRRDSPERREIEIHPVNNASRLEDLRECERERAITAPEIGPDRRSKCIDATIGEHVNRVATPHRGIIVAVDLALRSAVR